MDQAILIFLGVALAILALAFFISRAFKKTIARDRRNARHTILTATHAMRPAMPPGSVSTRPPATIIETG